jgi:hypothetical protein
VEGGLQALHGAHPEVSLGGVEVAARRVDPERPLGVSGALPGRQSHAVG